MPFVVPEDAADLPWIKAILAKEVEHASKPEGPGMGHWTTEEWQTFEAITRRDSQRRAAQQEQQQAAYQCTRRPVSYTHLTLPTILLV